MSRLRGFLRHGWGWMKAARGDDDRSPASAAEATPSRPRVDQWREWIQRTLAADGYLVQGSSEEMSTGSSVRMFGVDQAFQIVGPATYSEALRQFRVYQEICEEEMDPPAEPSPAWRYYKFGERKTAVLSDAR